MAGTIVNVCVYSLSKKSLLPWTIVSVADDQQSFSEFFRSNIQPRLAGSSETSYDVESAQVGPCKDRLDRVDLELQVCQVVESFGRYLKYVVTSTVSGTDEISGRATSGNAFEILMGSARALQSAKGLPDAVQEKNKKDKLYNDLLLMYRSRNLKMRANEAESIGVKVTRTLCDALWHIDGHHEVFSGRSTPLPDTFKSFHCYNLPELSKHRKREKYNLSREKLHTYASTLYTTLQANLWEKEGWCNLKHDVTQLAQSLAQYVEYLSQKNVAMKVHHASPTPAHELSDNLRLKFIHKSTTTQPSLMSIEEAMKAKGDYEYVYISDLLPSDPVKKHRLVKSLITFGLSFLTILLVYAPGSNIGNLHFLWKVPGFDPSQCFEKSLPVVEAVKKVLPRYHTRAMRTAMFQKFGRISLSVKPAALRFFYRDLTGDQSAASTSDQEQLDRRIQQIIDMEDPSVLPDLRALNSGQASRYDTFWEECAKFLSEEVGSAVDDRRHGQITHLARAISVRDLVVQVKSRCPPDTLIPSAEWVRLQFWPKSPAAKSSLQYTSRFRMKFMVQQRQWRRSHVDCHYAAATFRYMREYALMLHEHSVFVCIDNKHKVKVGEPKFPVAGTERGRRVPVRLDEYLTVGDHDFTKFGLVPSVVLVNDLPDEISESWYTGQVYVGLKDTLFEPSSPLRHACELCVILLSVSLSKSVLFVYSDGGPDHRLTYVSVQLSLIVSSSS